MFSQQWPTRKREREDGDDEYGASGFSEHRTKRRIAALPHRTSPNLKKTNTPIFSLPSSTSWSNTPLPPTITPADSDSEEYPQAGSAPPNNKSFFSPWGSSSPAASACTPRQTGDLHSPSFLLSSQNSVPEEDDDFEMTDSIHLSPGPFHADPSSSIASRIPTPIHSSFFPSIRSEKASLFSLPNAHNHTYTSTSDGNLADDESILASRFRRGRRLPSPISEGEMSPSIIVEGFGEMVMEVESPHPYSPQYHQNSGIVEMETEKETPTKKGHQRSKHSLRNWTGFDGEKGGMGGGGMKRSFSMGYRADCEKCRMKVPGHFSHIITY